MRINNAKAQARRNTLQSLGKVAKDIRTTSGLSQIDMAKITGYDASAICRFEQGKCDSAVLLWYYLTLAEKKERN